MLASHQHALTAIADPALDPLFYRPSRIGVESAWYGHIPFGYWLVCQARPRVLVELGTHNGVSYSAFCDAILDSRLATRCFAVDTWQGDAHAGLYGEEVFTNFRRFHDLRYGAFSTLLRMAFDEAVAQIPDGSIDLLHIDGEHTYEAVRRDFDNWLPKLSDRAVVLFHDTNVRERNFGVWRLWQELNQIHPGFEFLHASGLGVLAIGQQVPADVASLCATTDDNVVAAIRQRFARLGERCESESRLLLLQARVSSLAEEHRRWESELLARATSAEQAGSETAQELAEAKTAWSDTQQALVEAKAAWSDAERELTETRTALSNTELEVANAKTAWSNANRELTGVKTAWADTEHELAQTRSMLSSTEMALAEAQNAWSAVEAELGEKRRELSNTHRKLADLGDQLATARQRIAESGQEVIDASREWSEARRAFDTAAWELNRLRHAVATLSWEREIILNSTIWRMTAPLRWTSRAVPTPIRRLVRRLLRLIRRPMRTARRVLTRPKAATADTLTPPTSQGIIAATPTPSPVTDVSGRSPHGPVVFISGEPTIPGHAFRVARPAGELAASAVSTSCMALHEVPTRRDEIARAAVVIIWRAANCAEVADAIAAARRGGAIVVFDVDDLMFKPELASKKVIDGIRTQRLTEQDVADHYQRVKEVVVQADACSCTTEELARHLRELDKITFVHPNCFDAVVLSASRLAVRRRKPENDGIVRIGYAAGTRTHQRDFRPAAEALGRILRERPNCRLVLFRASSGGPQLLDPSEFPVLAELEEQIEWRDLVSLAELPNELVRFDINLAPIEIGNPFCEAKSELKYFEAALVEVCTVASPTGPLRRAIRDGETGRLADTPDAWYSALSTLIDDAPLRQRLAHTAYLDVLARFGPERSAESLLSMLRQLAGGPDAARQFEFDLLRQHARSSQSFDIPASDVVFAADSLGVADVTVIIPLYNYENFIEEALDSARNQTLLRIDLVVVDDASTDTSLQVALDWAHRHAERFNRVLVMRNQANSGLARSRNVGFDRAETQYVLPLDADNRLLPKCCDRLLDAVRGSQAAFAYSRLQCFGGSDHVIGTEAFSAMRFASSNYIDAMALVAKSAWARVGGYTHIQYGWEDYDFWCRCVEHGLWGIHVPETLAEYRFHQSSMLRTTTDTPLNKLKIIRQLEDRHTWLTLPYRG